MRLVNCIRFSPNAHQDKMLVRVQTAQHEMEQMKGFDYGEARTWVKQIHKFLPFL